MPAAERTAPQQAKLRLYFIGSAAGTAVVVYAGRGLVNGRRYAAAINIGPNPTFGEGAMKVEVHLVGWDGSPLYGQVVEVDFLRKLRDIQRFADVTALVSQLQKDVAAARQAFQDFELTDKLSGGGQPLA